MSNDATAHSNMEPGGNDRSTVYGSDLIADVLREFRLPFIAINPGASFRGLHDSIVNHLDNRQPKLVLTLHEAQAVGIAHGYAKVTGQPMGVVLHANVGLMNAVMAIYNAWTDRMPMLVIGATGTVDAAKRRPWIEWIHTSRDQAALVRPFVKWDDQPASVTAAVEALSRGWMMTRTAPSAPVYICLDVEIQESQVDKEAAIKFSSRDPARFPDPVQPTVADADLLSCAALISQSRRPVLLVGRHSRSEQSWNDRIRFAESMNALVICDQKCGVGFPSEHRLFVGAPAQYPDVRVRGVLDEADLVISLDWPDLAGFLSARRDKGRGLSTLIVSPDERLHNGWSLDHFPLPEANIRIPVMAETFVSAIIPRLLPRPQAWNLPKALKPAVASDGPITLAILAHTFDKVRGNRQVCLTRLPFGWSEALTRFTGPLDCIGYDGGGGIGSTPGITVGAGLALKGSGRIPVAILGDGDLLMGSQALWTAVSERIPALFIVNNNRAFYNDVEHQEVVARHRGRPVENREIGMKIDDPSVDLSSLARSYGLISFGAIERAEDLEAVLESAFQATEAGSTVLVDVRVTPPPPRS